MRLLVKQPGKNWGAALVLIFSVAVLGGCATTPATPLVSSDGTPGELRELMGRKNRIVNFPSGTTRSKPALLLLHGATDDPSEMMDIIREWKETYDVFLYSYNYHMRATKVGAALVKEMKRLKARNEISTNLTVVTYSYAAVVFRAAVILAHGESVFSGASLIQLVPTAGGSFLARDMGIFPNLVGYFSKPSAALYPFGNLAKHLWEGEGNRKFFKVILPDRMQSILLEGDSHSLSQAKDEQVRKRYENGIGRNVVVIPKSTGVTHEYFPTEPIALAYLRTALANPNHPAFANTNRANQKAPDPALSLHSGAALRFEKSSEPVKRVQ